MSRIRTITTALAAILLTAPAFAYDLTTPGNKTQFSVYGFAYGLANFYTTGASQPGGVDDLVFTGLPQNASDSGQVVFSTQASRYGFAAVTPTADYGDVTVKIEFDMNNLTQSNAFHMRHAYGTVGGFLMGQNWSNVVDLDASPDSVNWQGDIGDIGFDTPRRPQIRYTWNIDKSNKFSVSLEKNQGLDGDSYVGAVGGRPAGAVDAKVPAITASYTYSDSWGHIKISALDLYHGMSVGATNAGTAAAPGAATSLNNYSKSTFTGFVSGDVKFGKDDLIFSFYDGAATDDWGAGTQGTYFTATAAPYTVSINSYDQFGWCLGYTHVFTPAVRANLFAGGVNFKSNSSIPASQGLATAVKAYNDAGVNVFYTFAPNAQMGLEYYYETAKTFNSSNTIIQSDGTFGDTAKSGRVELLLKVNF
jgi:hypothetical protein